MKTHSDLTSSNSTWNVFSDTFQAEAAQPGLAVLQHGVLQLLQGLPHDAKRV
jgi:hypothetical protein